MAPQAQVELLLTARDQATQLLGKFSDTIDQIAAASGRAKDGAGNVTGALKQLQETSGSVTETAHGLRDALTDAFENPLGAVQNLGREVEHALGPLGAVVGVGVAAVAGLTAAVVELGQHGAEVNDVAVGFAKFAGGVGQASQILTAMRAGVQGTISDFALETDALHLMSAGVRLAVDDYGTLTQASLVLAHEGFGTQKDILDQLSESLITGRTRTIEKMTGTLDAKDAEVVYASQIGVSVEQLNKAG